MKEVKRKLYCLEDSTPHASPMHDPLALMGWQLAFMDWHGCTGARFCRGSSLLDLRMPQAVRALFSVGPTGVLLQTTFPHLDMSKARGSHQVGGILCLC